jgi:hypothetical protein
MVPGSSKLHQLILQNAASWVSVTCALALRQQGRVRQELLIAAVVWSAACRAGEQDVLGLAKYPFVPTFNANFSPLLTQLLTQQASWQMLELAPQLQQLLRP